MGFEKVVGSLAQVIEKEGGIGGAEAKPVDDRTKRPISSSKSDKILNTLGAALSWATCLMINFLKLRKFLGFRQISSYLPEGSGK